MDKLYFATNKTSMNLIDLDNLNQKLSKSFGKQVVFMSINAFNGHRHLKTVLDKHCHRIDTIDNLPDNKIIQSISSKTHVFSVHFRCHDLINRIDEIL